MTRNMFPLPVAAEVRPAEDLAALAATVNAAHEAGEGATRKGLEHFRQAGDALIKAKAQIAADNGGSSHGKWLAWLKKNVRFSQQQASKYIRVALEWDKVRLERNLADALRLLTEDAADDDGTSPVPKYVTLDQWNEAGGDFRKRLLTAESSDQFNAQGDNKGIEWALWSWNPITGCLNNCPYCYARDMAERFYDQKFTPSLWPGRLRAPSNTTFPEQKASEWMGHKNVFTCSMADLFGRWVPSEWIDAVLKEVRAAKQWNFLFLTKFPIRMAEFDFPENAWVGTTVDCQARVANAEKAFRKMKAGVKWLSIEPMIEPLKFADLSAFQWIVLGGASRSSSTPEWFPPVAWTQDIREAAIKAGVPFYLKDNLVNRVRQYPGDEPFVEPTEAPEALKYMPNVR